MLVGSFGSEFGVLLVGSLILFVVCGFGGSFFCPLDLHSIRPLDFCDCCGQKAVKVLVLCMSVDISNLLVSFGIK